MAKTCRELAKLLAKATDAGEQASVQEQLSLRERSHREPLKAKEKALRSKESFSIKEALALLKECERELPDDDSVLKRIRASVSSRESSFIESWQARLSKKSVTLRVLEEAMSTCEDELSTSHSSEAVELLTKIRSMLELRRNSHRAPIEEDVDRATKGSMSMKDIAKLKKRISLELSGDDMLVSKVEKAEKIRDANVRSSLVSRFKDMIRDLKKTKSSAIQNFMEECTSELDENDALLAQVRSTLENKLLETKGLKQVHNIDEVERGEREKVTDDLSTSRGKKTKSDASSKKKSKSSSKSGGGGTSAVSIIKGAVDVVSGFKSDLSGAPPSSSFYKLGIILVFMMYLSIVFYLASLVAKVTHYEVDLSVVTGKFSFPKPINEVAGLSAPIGAGIKSITKSDTALPISQSSVSASVSSSKEEEASEDSSGGGDDNDNDD